MNQPPVAFDQYIDPRRLAYLEGLERVGTRLCPHCGTPMQGSTPAQDEDYTPVPPKRSFTANVQYEYRGRGTPLRYDASGDRGVAPSPPPKKTYESWRDREPLL